MNDATPKAAPFTGVASRVEAECVRGAGCLRSDSSLALLALAAAPGRLSTTTLDPGWVRHRRAAFDAALGLPPEGETGGGEGESSSAGEASRPPPQPPARPSLSAQWAVVTRVRYLTRL